MELFRVLVLVIYITLTSARLSLTFNWLKTILCSVDWKIGYALFGSLDLAKSLQYGYDILNPRYFCAIVNIVAQCFFCIKYNSILSLKIKLFGWNSKGKIMGTVADA